MGSKPVKVLLGNSNRMSLALFWPGASSSVLQGNVSDMGHLLIVWHGVRDTAPMLKREASPQGSVLRL